MFVCVCVGGGGGGGGRRGVIADSCYILGKGNELKIFIFRVGGCSFFSSRSWGLSNGILFGCYNVLLNLICILCTLCVKFGILWIVPPSPKTKSSQTKKFYKPTKNAKNNLHK